FKLTKRDGPTRRVQFDTPPPWILLSSRIASLFDIPGDRVGVSYIDADGDEITVSSDEELRDYYALLFASGAFNTIRLTVLDLGSTRVTTETSSKPQPTKPTASHQAPFRNTFGGPDAFPLVFEVDDEWQNLPKDIGSLFLHKDTLDSPHAFVEVLDSDASNSRCGEDESRDGRTVRSHSPIPVPVVETSAEKGKGKAREDLQPKVEDDDASSIDSVSGSVFGGRMSPKPPVHVFDVSGVDIFEKADESSAQNGVATPAQAQSTPVFSEQTLKDVHSTDVKEPVTLESDDPPLPNIDSAVPSPSLTHDVATLLNSLSNIIVTHPELGEGIRRIVSNTADGTYWATHRDAISRAAENIQRTAAAEAGRTIEELRRTAEQEAGTRVAEALGRVFRTFSDGAQTRTGDGMQRADNSTAEALNTGERPSTTPGDPPVQPGRHPHNHRRDHRGSRLDGPNHHFHHHPRFSPFWGPYAPPLPPPPPPPPPPVSIPTIPHGPRSWPRPPPHRFWGRDDLRPEPRPVVVEPSAPALGRRTYGTDAPELVNVPSSPVTADTPATIQLSRSLNSNADPAPEELRVELEKAKAEYKARKERYRQAKAFRKTSSQRHKEKHDSSLESPDISRQVPELGPVIGAPTNHVKSSSVEHTPIPVPEPVVVESPVIPEPSPGANVHIVSNARGPYPQLEMFEVPRRSLTVGHTGRHHIQFETREQALNRIMRKLSDMGFTMGSHPNLRQKVTEQLIVHPPTSRDVEDDIVTNVIEELIPTTSNQPRAGPSRDSGIPGAWH
ncbi:hypothetical protein EDD16DRAFT_1459243, partial [Pisolithus croceorrhizus]